MPLTTDQLGSLADAVVLLMGVGDDAAVRDQAKSAAYLVTNFARAYTRGVGFDENGVPDEEIQSVVITASARLVANPSQASSESESAPVLRIAEVSGVPVADEKSGGAEIAVASYAHSGGFTGWTEIEKAILHQFRVRAG